MNFAVASADAYSTANPFILIGIYLVGIFGVPLLLGQGLYILRTRDLLCMKDRQRRQRLQGAARITGAACLSIYVWGAFHLLADETMAYDRCRVAVTSQVSAEATKHISAYEISYLPLRFSCRVDGVGYEASVPTYVNPVFFGLATATFICVISSRIVGSHDVSSETPKGTRAS